MMLPGIVGSGAGFFGAYDIQIVANLADAGGTSPHTFSSVNFGPDYTGRVLIACTCLRGNGSGPLNIASNGVSIGGVTATGDDNGNAGASGPGIGAGIAAAASVPGTSGDVVVTWSSATANAAGLILLSVPGISVSAFDTGAAGADPGGGTGANCSLNIPNSGLLIVACAHTNTNDETLTGTTEQASVVVGSGRLAIGYDKGLSSQSNRPVSASWTTSAIYGLYARSYVQS